MFKLCDLADLYNQNVVQLGLLKMMCTKQSLIEWLFTHVPDLQAYKQGSEEIGPAISKAINENQMMKVCILLKQRLLLEDTCLICHTV